MADLMLYAVFGVAFLVLVLSAGHGWMDAYMEIHDGSPAAVREEKNDG